MTTPETEAANPNREIYDHNYSGRHYELAPRGRYERTIVAIRQAYVERYAPGRDVLDLCCGNGSYLIPVLPRVRSAIGLDFSAKVLDDFRRALGGVQPANLTLLEQDATALALPDASVDFVFSYTALYTVPRLDLVLKHVSRVLRPGGHAVLELGNRTSVNTLVCNAFHASHGWAKPFFVPFAQLQRFVSEAGFTVVEWRSFQLLNNYGVPPRLIWLYPLATPLWKPVLGLRIGGKMLDEWIASAPLLRRLAFRHLVVVRKR